IPTHMSTRGQLRWLRAALPVGILYLVAGIVFAALAKSAGSHQLVVAWRLTAWLISAAAFAAHIWYENVRLRSSPTTTAFHAAVAVAWGAFGLAVAASFHAQSTHQHFPAFALAAWPLVTALPSFLVALAAAAVLTRARRS